MWLSSTLIAKTLTVYESQNAESIFVEITTVKKRKWQILFAYRPPNNINMKLFNFRKLPNLPNYQKLISLLQMILTSILAPKGPNDFLMKQLTLLSCFQMHLIK